MIPLRDGCVSVGAVCSPEYLKQRDVSEGRVPAADPARHSGCVRSAWRTRELAGNLHATGNYSYACTRMGGQRWLMVGDAYAFVDPIFSTGVFLAMHSAELAADVVAEALREPARERALQRALRARTCARAVASLSWFIFRFNTPAMT